MPPLTVASLATITTSRPCTRADAGDHPGARRGAVVQVLVPPAARARGRASRGRRGGRPARAAAACRARCGAGATSRRRRQRRRAIRSPSSATRRRCSASLRSYSYIGRRATYLTFFSVQLALFLLIPKLAAGGEWLFFLAALFTVFTMYGGGFATIPAFLADIFGSENVGAIHGSLLTAWSAAAVAGPLIITQLSESAKAALEPGASLVHIYDKPLAVLAGFLAVGLVLTVLVRPLKSNK